MNGSIRNNRPLRSYERHYSLLDSNVILLFLNVDIEKWKYKYMAPYLGINDV